MRVDDQTYILSISTKTSSGSQSKNATFFGSDTIRVNSSTNREGPSPTSKT